MLNDALIGYTGFVGGNILKQQAFDAVYNSENIETIQGKQFGLIVCAGAPGTKWVANKNPNADKTNIELLIKNLKTTSCQKLVLISTIDVYPQPLKGFDENFPIDESRLTAYGKHRHMLEKFVQNNFNALIIRLPGIFGEGLKKNIIYDLMRGSALDANPKSIFQFYRLNSLWPDINKALKNEVKILNIATEPIQLKELAQKIFGLSLPGQKTKVPVYYDMCTKHARLWGMDKPYLYSKTQVLDDLKTFVKNSG